MADRVHQLRQYAIGQAVGRRLHLNEFRFAHHPGVVAALREAAAAAPDALLTEYLTGPDPALAADIAAYVGAGGSECVLVTAGSDDALRAVVDTAPLRGQAALLMGAPGYTHFEHFARLARLEVVSYAIGLNTSPADHEAALRYHDGLMAAGCLVYLCSPNNPTGDMWAAATVDRLAAEFPRSTFLVDEAYAEFAAAGGAPGAAAGPEAPELLAPDPAAEAGDEASAGSAAWREAAAALNATSVASVALARPNVVVTRTFSKAFGLAALRVGYIVAAPATIQGLAVAVNPKAFSPLASAVARAALRHARYYFRAAAAARANARAAVAACRAAGWYAVDTPGNFFLLHAGDAPAPARLAAGLAAAGVSVRRRDELPGLSGFVRISAGGRADCEALLAALPPAPAGPPVQAFYAPKGRVAALKALVRKTAAVLRKAGLPFWAQSGTLLGAVRHGGILPADDDADLAYARGPDGHDPVAALKSAFAAEGLSLQRNRTDAYWQVGTNAPGEALSLAHLDLFSFSLVRRDGGLRFVADDVRFQAEDPGSPQAHCNPSFAPSELYPLRRGRFYDVELMIPAMAEEVLSRALGDDFMSVARIRAGAGIVVHQLSDFAPA